MVSKGNHPQMALVEVSKILWFTQKYDEYPSIFYGTMIRKFSTVVSMRFPQFFLIPNRKQVSKHSGLVDLSLWGSQRSWSLNMIQANLWVRLNNYFSTLRCTIVMLASD